MNAADSYINGLDYDPRNVIVDNSAVPSYQKEDGQLQNDGTFLVTKKKLCTVSSNTSELTYIDSLVSRLYPGVMLLCNSKLVENMPSTVALPTKPVKLTLDLPGAEGSFTVDALSKGSVDNAVRQKIMDWKTARPSGNIAAKVRYNVYEVKSQHKLETDLGFKLDVAKQNFNIDFNMVEQSKSREWVLKYEQIYYNATLDGFTKPGDIIADSVTEQDLKNLGVNNQNPIGIVNNVNYGRIIYVHFKTEDMSLDIKTKMSLVLSGDTKIDINAKLELQDLNNKVSTDVFVYGGGTSAFEKVPEIRIDTVADFIAQGYNFDTNQEAAPIGYSVVFMKNGGQDVAMISSTSTYVETTTERFDRARLHIEQSGAFVNCFNITWNEISYSPGNPVPVVTSRGWERNGKDSCAGQSYDLFFNGNVRNIHINSKGYTGIIWDKTRTNFDRTFSVPPATEMRLKIRGTTLSQKADFTS